MRADVGSEDPLRPAVRTLVDLCAQGAIDDATLGESLRALAVDRPDGWSLVALAVGGTIRRWHPAREVELWQRIDAAEPQVRRAYAQWILPR